MHDGATERFVCVRVQERGRKTEIENVVVCVTPLSSGEG